MPLTLIQELGKKVSRLTQRNTCQHCAPMGLVASHIVPFLKWTFCCRCFLLSTSSIFLQLPSLLSTAGPCFGLGGAAFFEATVQGTSAIKMVRPEHSPLPKGDTHHLHNVSPLPQTRGMEVPIRKHSLEPESLGRSKAPLDPRQKLLRNKHKTMYLSGFFSSSSSESLSESSCFLIFFSLGFGVVFLPRNSSVSFFSVVSESASTSLLSGSLSFDLSSAFSSSISFLIEFTSRVILLRPQQRRQKP